MVKNNYSRHIVGIEVMGFGLIVLLTWLDELVRLPALLFGGEHPADYTEATMETTITICVAIPVLLITRKLLARLHYLEGFMQVCAWCRKVEHDGSWLVMEEYFRHRFNTLTSHGMCPECYAKISRETKGDQPSAGASTAGGEACRH